MSKAIIWTLGLFEEKRQVELVWNGKSGEVTNVVLPFQIIEQVDEPRKESNNEEKQNTLFDFDVDTRGRQLKGWTNKLIWGDNKLAMSSLLPKFSGKIKLWI